MYIIIAVIVVLLIFIICQKFFKNGKVRDLPAATDEEVAITQEIAVKKEVAAEQEIAAVQEVVDEAAQLLAEREAARYVASYVWENSDEYLVGRSQMYGNGFTHAACQEKCANDQTCSGYYHFEWNGNCYSQGGSPSFGGVMVGTSAGIKRFI